MMRCYEWTEGSRMKATKTVLTVEDFLYAQRFDESRLPIAKKRLADLEEFWR